MNNDSGAVGLALGLGDWIDPLAQALREGVLSYLREQPAPLIVVPAWHAIQATLTPVALSRTPDRAFPSHRVV